MHQLNSLFRLMNEGSTIFVMDNLCARNAGTEYFIKKHPQALPVLHEGCLKDERRLVSIFLDAQNCTEKY